MFSNKKAKYERLHSGLPDTVSANTYNLILGGCVLYGLIMNLLLVLTCGEFVMALNPTVVIIGYFISVILGAFISRSTSPVVSFIGYNFIAVPIGLLLSASLPLYALDTIIVSFGATAAIVTIMIALSTAFPHFFLSLGRTLGITLLATIVVELVAILLGFSVGWIDFIVVGIFTLYVGFDWSRAQAYPKTIDNAVDSAIDIYMDVINIFLRILSILSRSDD
jgi:FtsH-binding integral membrane protein